MENKIIDILLIEDEEAHAELIQRAFDNYPEKYLLNIVGTISQARIILTKSQPDIVIADMKLPDGDSIELLPRSIEEAEVPFIIITSYGDEKAAVTVMKKGALDYIPKSVGMFDSLPLIIDSSLRGWKNIVDRKNAEKALQEGEERFRALYNNSPNMLASVSPIDGNIILCNETLLKNTGYLKEEIIGNHIFNLYHEECINEAEKTFQQFIEIGVVRDKELIMKRKDGSRIYVSLNANAVRDNHGRIKYSMSSWRDITDQIQVKNELRKLSVAMIQSPISIVITDAEGDIEYVNPKFSKITDYSLDEVLGEKLHILNGEEKNAGFYKDIWDTISSGKSWYGEYNNQKKNGEMYWEKVTIGPIFDEKRKITNFIVLNEDITEIKKLEEQLYQSQKLEAIGVLAGGVAHDFNNILTAISGFGELVQRQMDVDSKLWKDLQEILDASDRAANLTRQLLVFSRKEVIKPEKINVNPLIEKMNKMLQRLIGEDISITMHLSEGLHPVLADPGQLEQVVLNLCVNAKDGIRSKKNQDKKEIIVSTSQVFLEKKDLIQKEGYYLKISVKDTGCGIPDSIKENVFDPFFTTKGKGKGTGLGLSTTHGIVMQNKGFIEMDSEEGIGTEFIIYWPSLTTEWIEKTTVRKQKVESQKGIVVLSVEDDKMLQRLNLRILENSGFKVLSASNGKEALEVYDSYEGKVDILFTDVIMPGLNGPELAEQLKKKQSDLVVVFTSGYTDDLIGEMGVIDEGLFFLRKPQTPVKMVDMLLSAFKQK